LRRNILFFVLIFLPLAAGADDCFDFSAWQAGIVKGDAAAAETALAAALSACDCADETDKCLVLPGQTVPTTPGRLRAHAKRLLDWRADLDARCARTDVPAGEREPKRRECLITQATAFSEGLAGEPDGGVLRDIPKAIVREMLPGGEGDVGDDGLPEVTPEKVYSLEAQTIGKQICRLTLRLDESNVMLDRVLRQTTLPGAERRNREMKLKAAIKELTETIVALKKEFTQMTGEPFNPFTFCSDEILE